MKRILGWGMMMAFVVSLCVGAAACSHSHKDSGSYGSTSKKRDGSKPNSGYGY